MYIYGISGPSLLIESTDSMIIMLQLKTHRSKFSLFFDLGYFCMMISNNAMIIRCNSELNRQARQETNNAIIIISMILLFLNRHTNVRVYFSLQKILSYARY